MKITKEILEEMKQKALIYYKNNKIINSALFWKVKITNEWFNHIEWKNKDHKRDFKEAYVRYVCFFHTKYILENSHLYQEYRSSIEQFKIKIWSKKYKEVSENTHYYWFVAIVNWDKHRVRIVIKKHEWSKSFEFVSVIPAWKKEGYLWNRDEILFFNDDVE